MKDWTCSPGRNRGVQHGRQEQVGEDRMIQIRYARWAAWLCAIVFIFSARPGEAADWPTRPVRMIVTLGASSGVDIGARLFADKLSTLWKQPVVVENRPGGDGILAITSFLSAH